MVTSDFVKISEKRDITLLSEQELSAWLTNNNEATFRYKQISEWIWKRNISSFSDMKNISASLQKKLENDFWFNPISISKTLISKDGSRKYIFELSDGLMVEGVLIPSENRNTACISSQAGCPLACAFCATGIAGFHRNLSFDEIYRQVLLINEQSLKFNNKNLTNIVLMGMGEPLLNYENVMQAINLITTDKGMAMSAQRIMLSTVGIVDKIRQLADEKPRFQLALSLHSANDEKRNKIIPSSKQNSIPQLIEALKYYNANTAQRIHIEYAMFDNFNDNVDDAKNLLVFCKNFPVKINLIPYNSTTNTNFKSSSKEKIIKFASLLLEKNLVVTIRESRGSDIDAACGQLANKPKYN